MQRQASKKIRANSSSNIDFNSQETARDKKTLGNMKFNVHYSQFPKLFSS